MSAKLLTHTRRVQVLEIITSINAAGIAEVPTTPAVLILASLTGLYRQA